MGKITLLGLLLLIFASTSAQEIYLEGGKTSSNFKYTDSRGEMLDNIQAENKNFMAVGYSNKLFCELINWSLGANYSSYGVLGSIGDVDNYLQWDVNYLEFDFGLKLALFNLKKATFYVKGVASSGFMLQGTQTINNSVYDLKNIEEFSNKLLNFKGGAGFSHPISENLSFYVQYLYGKSSNIEKGDAEKLNIKYNNFSFGLIINLAQQNNAKSDIN